MRFGKHIGVRAPMCTPDTRMMYSGPSTDDLGEAFAINSDGSEACSVAEEPRGNESGELPHYSCRDALGYMCAHIRVWAAARAAVGVSVPRCLCDRSASEGSPRASRLIQAASAPALAPRQV